MEEKIEGREAETSAMAEVDEALRGGAAPPGDLEAKFRKLEGELGTLGKGGVPSDIDDELAALKKRIRV
jgi:phage shock protein A